MKTLSRIAIVAFVIALMIPLVPTYAQDGDELTNLVEPKAIYYQTATSGSFADNGDDTYTLTLEGVGQDVTWLATSPGLQILTLGSENLFGDWAANENSLSTTGVLRVDDLNIEVELSAPEYNVDSESITYVVSVGNINSVDPDNKEPELPMSFDAAELSISWSLDFQNGLVEGIVARFGGIRATPEECQAAQEAYNELNVQMTAKMGEATARVMTCRGWDGTTDPAVRQQACDEIQSINVEIISLQTEMGTYALLLNSEC